MSPASIGKIVKYWLEGLGRPLTKFEVRKLRAVWNSVPHVRCKGLCYAACRNVPIMPIEAYYLIQKHGAEIQPAEHQGFGRLISLPTLGAHGMCEFLKGNRCSIYEDRPMICRAYGHDVLTLNCHHGCVTKHSMSPLHVFKFIRELIRILAPKVPKTFDETSMQVAWDTVVKQAGQMVVLCLHEDE